jgi:hypothetical protein
VNEIEFAIIGPCFKGSPSWSEVRPFVDGRDLIDRIAEFEAPFAGKLAGRYMGLCSDAFSPDRFLGRCETWYGENEDKVAVLSCECGEEGCWPLAVRILSTPETIVWTGFEQPHRSRRKKNPDLRWDYSGFGPFTFDRAAYVAELELAKETLRSPPPDRVPPSED